MLYFLANLASARVAHVMPGDKYALIFGVNTFVSLAFQTALQLILSRQGLDVTITTRMYVLSAVDAAMALFCFFVPVDDIMTTPSFSTTNSHAKHVGQHGSSIHQRWQDKIVILSSDGLDSESTGKNKSIASHEMYSVRVDTHIDGTACHVKDNAGHCKRAQPSSQ